MKLTHVRFTEQSKRGLIFMRILIYGAGMIGGKRMKELMSVYCVIGKIPAVRSISNKIIVLKKRG